MLSVSFDEFESALAAVEAPVAAAEAHGALCGALAGISGFSAADWLADLVPRAGTSTEPEALRSRNLLETVYDETLESLTGADMDFEPLLPDDEESLERRVAALAAWCSGFLYGLGTASVPPPEQLTDEVAEVLRDFAEIARAVVDSDESPESGEASYAELVEYLRAGTQLTFEELGAARDRAERT
jgi:uncharacterized protein YgfB (UPF0149 family)